LTTLPSKRLEVERRITGFYGWHGKSIVQSCIMAVYQGKPTTTPIEDFQKIFYQHWLRNYDSEVSNAIFNFDTGRGTKKDFEIIKMLSKQMDLLIEVVSS